MKLNENQKFAAPLFKQWLPLNLQFFADGGDDGSDDDDSDDDGDDSTDEMNLDELLKDPAFKKQYQAKLKEQLNKRMKKYADIDPDEYRRLKEQADKKKGKDKEDDGEESDSLSKEKEQKLLRAERREKRAAVKEFAADNGYNPKLLARLIDIDAIELDEDGEPENLDELFEEIQEDFPEFFGQQDDEEEESTKKKKPGYKPGSNQKGNKPKEKDNYQVGVSSYERLKQSGRIR